MSDKATLTIHVSYDEVIKRIPELKAALRLAHAADALGWTVEADYMAGAAEFKAALKEWKEVCG